MLNPVHPGEFIRSEIIPMFGLSVTAAAARLGVSRSALSCLLNGRAALSEDMAARVVKAFGRRTGVPGDVLLRMQASYDLAQRRQGRAMRRNR